MRDSFNEMSMVILMKGAWIGAMVCPSDIVSLPCSHACMGSHTRIQNDLLHQLAKLAYLDALLQKYFCGLSSKHAT